MRVWKKEGAKPSFTDLENREVVEDKEEVTKTWVNEQGDLCFWVATPMKIQWRGECRRAGGRTVHEVVAHLTRSCVGEVSNHRDWILWRGSCYDVFVDREYVFSAFGLGINDIEPTNVIPRTFEIDLQDEIARLLNAEDCSLGWETKDRRRVIITSDGKVVDGTGSRGSGATMPTKGKEKKIMAAVHEYPYDVNELENREITTDQEEVVRTWSREGGVTCFNIANPISIRWRARCEYRSISSYSDPDYEVVYSKSEHEITGYLVKNDVHNGPDSSYALFIDRVYAFDYSGLEHDCRYYLEKKIARFLGAEKCNLEWRKEGKKVIIKDDHVVDGAGAREYGSAPVELGVVFYL